MITTGLLVRLEARHGKEDEVEAFLASALPLVRQEPATVAWFAVRFGRGEYGIVDFFPDAEGRLQHLSGEVAKALGAHADELFSEAPVIDQVDVFASKLPAPATAAGVTKGLLLTFEAKDGKDDEVINFLRDAQSIVDDEPDTTAWFALRLPNNEYGIFDVFPDNGARLAHLTGHVPRELAKEAFSLLGSVPEMHLLNVVESNY